MNTSAAVGGGIATLVIIMLFIVFGPIVVIWALNALFPVLAIPLTFKTWFATMVICGVMRGQTTTSKS